MSTLTPPETEFESRLERVRRLLAELDLDLAIVTRPENIFYLSNFRASAIASWTARFHSLLVGHRDARLLARSLESRAAQRQWTSRPLLWSDHEDPYRITADAIAGWSRSGAARPTRVGVEKSFMTVEQFDRLREALPDTVFVNITGEIERAASDLSDHEVACMVRAAHVAGAGMTAAMSAVEIGHHSYDVIAAIQSAMYGAGQSDFEKSFVAVWADADGGMMHDTDATHEFADGDLATIEIMGVQTHYTACAQTTVRIGDREPSDEILRAHQLIVEMNEAARAVLRAGVLTGQVYDAANAVYRRHHGADYFRRVGGSIGLTMFALDFVKGGQTPIPEGTPVLIQTLVNDPALLACGTTVLVTDDGYRTLTPSPGPLETPREWLARNHRS